MSNKKLNAIITIGGEIAGSLRTAIGSTTSQLGKIGSEIQRVKKQQSMLGESIRTFGSMGKNVDNLRARYSSVTDELNRLTKAQERLNRVEKLRQQNTAIRNGSAKVLGGAMAASATMIVPVKLAIDFESSMADVKKVFSGTDAQFKTITNEVLKMSTVLPMAATDIAKIVASGAQSGIAANELTKFAESAVKMGVAFDVSAEEAGQSMAEMRTAFKMSQDEVITLADKINFLGNSTPAAAKGIMEIVQRIGPLGEVGGFASGSIAALGATMRGMGVQEEIAATGIKNMMLALIAGESATKSQRSAMIDLGLDSEEVAKSMQKDAEGTTLKILELIKALPKEKQGAMLATLFGKESLSAIAPLLTNMGALEENLKKVGDATKYAGSMNDEYKARAETTANNIILFKNKIAELGISIGSVLLPPLNIFLGKMGTVVDKVSAWSKANPELSSTLTKVAVGAVAVVGGIAAVALGVTTVIGPIALAISSFSVLGGSAGVAIGMLTKMIAPIKMIGTVLGFVGKFGVGLLFKMVSAIKMIGTVFAIVGKAMLANPMILAITAIVVVVVGAAYLIYKHWDKIKVFFAEFVDKTKAKFADFGKAMGAVWDSIKAKIQPVIDMFKWIKDSGAAILGGIGGAVGKAYEKTKAFFTGGNSAPSKAPSTPIPHRSTLAPQIRGANTKSIVSQPNITQSFTINAAPGQNPNEIANIVMQKINRANGVAQRGSMLDAGYAQ